MEHDSPASLGWKTAKILEGPLQKMSAELPDGDSQNMSHIKTMHAHHGANSAEHPRSLQPLLVVARAPRTSLPHRAGRHTDFNAATTSGNSTMRVYPSRNRNPGDSSRCRVSWQSSMCATAKSSYRFPRPTRQQLYLKSPRQKRPASPAMEIAPTSQTCR